MAFGAKKSMPPKNNPSVVRFAQSQSRGLRHQMQIIARCVSWSSGLKLFLILYRLAAGSAFTGFPIYWLIRGAADLRGSRLLFASEHPVAFYSYCGLIFAFGLAFLASFWTEVRKLWKS